MNPRTPQDQREARRQVEEEAEAMKKIRGRVGFSDGKLHVYMGGSVCYRADFFPSERGARRYYEDVRRATLTVDPPKKKARLLLAGSRLANCCFNLSQCPGHVLTQRDVDSMGAAQREWDAAWAAMPKKKARRKP